MSVVLAVVLAWTSVGCAHSRGSTQSRFVRGSVPDYEAAWRELNRPPEESLSAFIERVRRLSAAARVPRSPLPSIESSDPALREALLRLTVAPTAENHWRVGEAYRRVGVTDMAYDHFREAVHEDSAYAPAWDGLARVWRDWGYPQHAVANAHRAVYFAPAHPGYRNTLGTVLHALGRRSEAKAQYERALADAPDAPWALNNLCLVAVEEGRRQDAVALCRRAVAAGRSAIPRANLQRALHAPEPAPGPANPARPDRPLQAKQK